MFASQLLRILETIPTDVNYETCAFDTPKPKLTMTENQIGIICHSNRYERVADPLSFSARNQLHANGQGGNPNSLAFGVEDGHDFWSSAIPKYSEALDNSTKSNGNESGDSPVSSMVGDQNGVPCHLNGFNKKDAESFAFDTMDKNETQITQEAAHSMIEGKLDNHNEEESKDSETSTTVPQSFESDLNPYTDKNVAECELPEIVVCYRESNIQIVKDICVDEGVPAENRILIESEKDHHMGSFVSQPSDEDRDNGTTKGDPDIEFFVSDGFKASSPEDIGHSSANECGTEKVNTESFVLEGSKSSSGIYDSNGAAKEFCPPQMDETKWSTSIRTADDGSEEGSAISSERVSEEFILQDALLESSKCDEKKVALQPEEIPSIEAILESLAMAFTSEESKKDGPVSNLCYNSKVEGGTITFDFNSSKPVVTSSMDGSAELTPGKAPETDDEKQNDHLAPTPDQFGISEEKSKENAYDLTPLRQDASNNENGNSGNLSVSSRLQRGEGESSFSTSGPVSGLITYSGPIAVSGNVSLRSDSSTTSTRSFAFPILQTEWNSSPVRMERADRRHFRKHRGWRHGLFCCRF